MHLVHPLFLSGDAPIPNIAIRAYAQVLCESFAQQLGVQSPYVVITNRAFSGRAQDDKLTCHSPAGQTTRLAREGVIALAPIAYSNLHLQFILAHHLAHYALKAAEWVCDLIALDLMNCLEVPVVERTALTIARESHLREKALQFKSGDRVVAVGDALASHIWDNAFE
jgi:hypothetical protein